MSFNSVNRELSAGVGNSTEQQSFLGATIQGFNVSAGFGDSSSQLTVNLVADKDFESDGTALGQGADPYHDGEGDELRAPAVGSPVFFSYGKFRTSTQEAFSKTIDDYYGTKLAKSLHGGVMILNKDGEYVSGNRGYYNFSFGGLLQSFVMTDGSNDGIRYSITITDPREILGNCQLILNSYGGDTGGKTNLWNIYGLLEHNASNVTLKAQNDPDDPSIYKDILNAAGQGMDIWINDGKAQLQSRANSLIASKLANGNFNLDYNYYVQALKDSESRPMTGTGMSRRTSTGIPYYRVVQALNYLQFGDSVHPEYEPYGSFVFFRGLKYALDFGNMPILPKAYMLDYDAISILDFLQEIAEATNHELFFSLLPIVDGSSTGTFSSDCAGVIKVNAIGKNNPSEPGQIAKYIKDLGKDIDVTNSQIGYELTNEPTDKVVTGGRESAMYYFPTPYGGATHGMHNYSTQEAIIPFYGTVGAYNVPTIPRGYGSYQQICLDASSLTADGVGRFYIATEIELRAASVSFEKWSEFLLMYNSMYKESIENNDVQDLWYANNTPAGVKEGQVFALSNNYQITVPRCVWPAHEKEDTFVDGEPANPCHPPYGWPLYWHRARNIGLPQAGAIGVSANAAQILDEEDQKAGAFINPQLKGAGGHDPTGAGDPTDTELTKRSDQGAGSGSNVMQDELHEAAPSSGVIATARARNATATIAQSDKIARSGLKNAKLIYQFLKKVSDDCLGKKYLVKIPSRPNPQYKAEGPITALPTNNFTGLSPYGFPYTGKSVPASYLTCLNSDLQFPGVESIQDGGLKTNWHTSIGGYSHNYAPAKDGGWYTYDTILDERRKHSLEPHDNGFLKGSNARIQCYARFCNSHTISFAGFSKSDYSQQFINPANNTFVPDLNLAMENSDNPNDKLDQGKYAFTPITVDGKTFLPTQAVAFVKCDIEEDFYIAPPKKDYNTNAYGNRGTFEWTATEPGKIWNSETCKEEETFAVAFQVHRPLPVSTGGVKIPSMDLEALSANMSKGDSKNGVFALITMPDRAVSVISSTFRDGMDMQVNAANIKHYLMLDVVRGMPGINGNAPLRPTNSLLDNIHDIADPDDPLDLANRSNADAAIRKAYQGLTFDLTNRINIMSPSPVVPDLVAIPLESQERNYGPWLSNTEAYSQIGGKVDYIHDENITPWNYGSYTLMDQAGRIKVELATSAQLMVEKGSFSLPMFPSGLTLGSALGGFGPIVSNMNIRVDAQGIETSVTMETYTKSFGKIQKQREDQLRKLTRESQKMTDLNNGLIRKQIAKSQKGFNYGAAIRKLENRLTTPDFTSRNYSELEKTTSGHSSTNLNMSVDPRPSVLNDKDSFNPIGSGQTDISHPDSFAKADLQKTSSMQSQEAQNFMTGLVQTNLVQASKLFQNSVQQEMSEMFAPIAHGWHQAFTVAPPSTPVATSRDYGDGLNDKELSSHSADK